MSPTSFTKGNHLSGDAKYMGGGKSVDALDEIEVRWQTVPSQTQQIIY